MKTISLLKKMRFGILLTLTLPLFLACSNIVHRANKADVGARWKSESLVKNVPFKAREQQDQLRQRVFLLPLEGPQTPQSNVWRQKAEKFFLKELEDSHLFVLLTPQDLELNLNDFKKVGTGTTNQNKPPEVTPENKVITPATAFDSSTYDLEALYQAVHQKGVTVVVLARLAAPIEKEKIDPMGIVRTLDWHKEVTLTVQVFDPKRKKELWSRTEHASQSDRELRWFARDGERTQLDPMPDVLDELAENTIKQMLPPLQLTISQLKWSGRVALVKGERIFLNVGRLSGLQIGDLLKVTDHKGDEVFDPETGESIGKVPGNMKGTLEIISYFGQDGAISVAHSGAGFQENDQVELY